MCCSLTMGLSIMHTPEANMELNKELTTTGIFRPGQPAEIFHDYNIRLNRMQTLAFQIGQLLAAQQPGTAARISDAAQVTVVTFRDKLETVLLEHYEASQADDDVQWFCIAKQPYQDCDWGGEEQLDEMSRALEAWLASPVYEPLIAGERIQSLAKSFEAWIEDLERTRLKH